MQRKQVSPAAIRPTLTSDNDHTIQARAVPRLVVVAESPPEVTRRADLGTLRFLLVVLTSFLVGVATIAFLDGVHQMSTLLLTTAAIGGTSSLLVCLLIVSTKRWHGRLTLDTTNGVQKFHSAPTPRVGGIAILGGVVCEWLALRLTHETSALANLLGPILLASLPAFAFGFLEDLTKRVGVRMRLFATMASGLLACWLSGTRLSHVDVWGIDTLLTIAPISMAFTAFAVGGVANALNIIDGFNGLASGSSLLSLLSMMLVALRVGDIQLVELCLLVQMTILGFAIVNFPLGKIFLGDGGAYTSGFLLAWLAVLLPMRNSVVSPWAGLLACGYPVIEVLFSIWRKYNREGYRPGQPDKVHLHMLFHSRLARRAFSGLPTYAVNSGTSLFLWAYAAVPAALAIFTFKNTTESLLAFAVAALLYWVLYLRLTQFRWCLVTFTKT